MRTIKSYIDEYPRNTGEKKGQKRESITQYYKRIYRLMKKDKSQVKLDSVRRVCLRYRKEWEKVSENRDKYNNVTTSKHKLKTVDNTAFRHARPVALTTNPNGPDWVKYDLRTYEAPEIDKELIKRAVKGVTLSEIKPIKIKHTKNVLRLIYTDTHVGMETDLTGFGLYGGVWNADEIESRLIIIIKEVLKRYQGEYRIDIIDLGDFLDGWDGMTVRKGHDLPQNMDNVDAFLVGTKFKIKLAEELYKHTGAEIHVFDVVNDNHAGEFGAIVSHSVKNVLKETIPNIKHHTLRQFMSHYIIGKHCFILCHGKDSHHVKFGFKPNLDPKGADKINEYIRINKLYDYYVHFEKGDTHLQLFDWDVSDSFNYLNYRALSPSSEWVQTNFKRGKSGFTIMKVEQDKEEPIMIPNTFPWKIKESVK